MGKIQDSVISRFNELQLQSTRMPVSSEDGYSLNASNKEFYAWANSALTLIQGTFGSDSPHFMHFESEIKSISNNYVTSSKLDALTGMFLGAKSDVDGGHLYNIQASFTGEIFSDFVMSAKQALAEGHNDVACVLACAALEDALKRYASMKELSVENKTLEEVINALKGKGLVSGAQKGLLDAMPRVRNFAMHAEWSKLTPQDAGSVIGFVEQFLLSNF